MMDRTEYLNYMINFWEEVKQQLQINLQLPAVSSGNKEFMKQQIKSFDSKIKKLKYQLEMEKL